MPLILVTGASQGIGAAICTAFAAFYKEDAQLALVARSTQKLASVADACQARGADATAFPCDVTDEEAVAAMAAAVQDRYGLPDVLVNNAGLFEPAALPETSPALFRRQVEVNLTSAFLVTHAFLPAMAARGHGDLFFMASVAALQGYPGGAAYCAAKHGLLGLARVVREESKEDGLRVVTLLPGATRTPSWDGTDLPDDRFIAPEDVAQVVLDAHRLSPRTVVEEIVIRPQLGDI